MNKMKKNVWLLSLCQALMNSGNSLLVATSSLVGYALATDKSLATLPLALQFLTTMLTSVPASLLMKRVGRRAGFIVGTLLGLAGSGLAAIGIVRHDFVFFCAGAAFFGAFNGFGTYYRFAAADAATPDYRSTAISYVMAGGVVAAFVGPNLASWTHDWLTSTPFAGSYVALMGIYAASLLVLLGLDMPPPAHESEDRGRPLKRIAAQGTYVVAVLGAALGYGIMSLVMTATPLAMHAHEHPFEQTAFVIQWHVFAMFAPSFFTGHLIRRFGTLNVMVAGAVLTALCVAVNLAGTQVVHFWAGLFLLGLGWNFLFVGGTTLLTETYRPEEKAKAQALNDFLVFTVVTLASLSAGALQHHFGWETVNVGVLPLIAVIVGSLLWLRYQRRMALAAGASL